MVAPSKLFTSPLKFFYCSQMLPHPGIGCLRYFIDNLLSHSLAGLKYFSPLLITPLVLKYKSMNRELFVNTIKYYLQTVCWTTLATSTVFLLVCCLRILLGKFRVLTTFFIPTVLGMQFCWLFPARVMKLFTTATSQATLEALCRQNSNKFTKLIVHSPFVQTILFMLNSAIILHYKRKNICKDFWFIQPYEKLNEPSVTKGDEDETLGPNDETKGAEVHYRKCQTKCVHASFTCKTFLVNGMKTYLAVGVALDLLSMLVKSKVPQETKGFLCKVIEKFKIFRPNMTVFFLSYVGIYRLSACALHKYYVHLPKDLQHIMSAFLGGLSYVCVKRANFVFSSMVISTQLLWLQLCKNIKTKLDKKPNLVLLLIKNAPLSQIILSLNCGYLVHQFIFNDHLVNSLARGFLDALTCNKVSKVRQYLLNNELQAIVNTAKLNSIKMFF